MSKKLALAVNSPSPVRSREVQRKSSQMRSVSSHEIGPGGYVPI